MIDYNLLVLTRIKKQLVGYALRESPKRSKSYIHSNAGAIGVVPEK